MNMASSVPDAAPDQYGRHHIEKDFNGGVEAPISAKWQSLRADSHPLAPPVDRDGAAQFPNEPKTHGIRLVKFWTGGAASVA